MKKIKLFAIVILFFTAINAIAQPIVKVVSQSATETIVEIFFPENNVSNNFSADKIALKGCNQWQVKGAPDLPKFAFSLQVPYSKDAVVGILEMHSNKFQNVYVGPSKGRFSRDQDPEKIIATQGNVYQANQFFPTMITNASKPYLLRDLRGQTIHVSPIQYNPITKDCLAFSYLKLIIQYNIPATQNIVNRFEPPTNINETFAQLYANQFVNYSGNLSNDIEKKQRYTPVVEGDQLLVLCPNKYLANIAPFVKWKKMKGIHTTLVDVDTIAGGVNQVTIFNTIKSYYEQKAISHVQMVGNVADIPQYTGATIFGVGSDNPYGYLAGGDHYPDVMIGRFVGTSAADIDAQVYKSVQYEKLPQLQSKWFSNAMAIASNQGPGDDAQYDWQHERDIADSLINQGPYKHKYELFDGNHGGVDGPNNPISNEIIDSINTRGASVINYTGHGSATNIVTGQFSVNEVPYLTNTNGNWPFMLVVGCSPGYYVDAITCLAEKLSTSTDANQKPIGTVINAMSTVAQWWYEPMQAQDEFNAVMRNARKFPIKHTFAGMLNNGFCSMMDQYNLPGTSDSVSGDQMTDTWQIFGDPTLVVRTDDSGKINAGYSNNIPVNATSFTVSCNTEGADGCLFYKNEILAIAKVIGGVLNFSFPQGKPDNSFVDLTVTKYDYIPYIYSSPTSIANNVIAQSINVYPNPASDKINIESPVAIEQLQIINSFGQVVVQQQTGLATSMQLNIESIAPGLYTILVQTKSGIIAKKFVKK
jgi:gingipain R